MVRTSLCTAAILLGFACVSESEDHMSRNPLIESVLRITPSVLPILTEDPSKKNVYRIRGTGFIIHEGGLIATASHIAKIPDIHIGFKGAVYPCSVVEHEFTVTQYANDPKRKTQHIWDIAVLKIEGTEGPFLPVKLSAKTDFLLGEPVAIYGWYDEGQLYSAGGRSTFVALLTSGIVSAAFSNEIPEMKLGSHLALDITGGPGSSGGPAFDPESGEVIGIVSQGKAKRVLSLGAEPTQVKETRVPMGITETEPIIHLHLWLREVAPKLGYK